MKQKATIALFLVTIVWGWTFIWLKNALDASAPYITGNQTNIVATLFVTLRFSIAVILFFLIFHCCDNLKLLDLCIFLFWTFSSFEKQVSYNCHKNKAYMSR